MCLREDKIMFVRMSMVMGLRMVVGLRKREGMHMKEGRRSGVCGGGMRLSLSVTGSKTGIAWTAHEMQDGTI